MEGDFILMYIPSKKIKAAKFWALGPRARSEEKKKVLRKNKRSSNFNYRYIRFEKSKKLREKDNIL